MTMNRVWTSFSSNLKIIPDVLGDEQPYVVLVGNVGAGKSTIVEKLTGATGRSSTASESFTRNSEYIWVQDKSLLIADTPGANPRQDKMGHNLEIAAAFNHKKVSKVLIVVKADVRLDQTLDQVVEYADRFVVLPMDAVGIIVTHMDKPKEWNEDKFSKACEEDIGINDVVFTGEASTGEELLQRILNICNQLHNLNIDSELFFRLFKIKDSNRKILKVTSDMVHRFQIFKRYFDEEKGKFSDKEQVDLFFEYMAFMTEQVEVAKGEMSEKLEFDFYGEKSFLQAGHVANMVNQIRAVMYDIRTEALRYQMDHGTSELRRCPHCNRVWAKVEGCDGSTTCGNKPSTRLDLRSSAFSVMATFTFNIGEDGRLQISKSGEKRLSQSVNSTNEFEGCGKSITWSEMPTVPVPEEFKVTEDHVNTDDIMCLPSTGRRIYQIIETKLRRIGIAAVETMSNNAIQPPIKRRKVTE